MLSQSYNNIGIYSKSNHFSQMKQKSLYLKREKIERKKKSNSSPDVEKVYDINFENLRESRKEFVKFIRETAQIQLKNVNEFQILFPDYNTEGFKIIDSKHAVNMMEKRVYNMKKNHKSKTNWSPAETDLLIWIILRYAQNNRISLEEIKENTEAWKYISFIIPGTTPSSCFFRWLRLKNVRLSVNAWTTQESKILSEIVQTIHMNSTKCWRLVSQKLYQLNTDPQKIYRRAKQCKQHWVSFLNPNLKKGLWEPTEDIILIRWILHNKGARKWYKAIDILGGRTENAIKNRYRLLIDRKRQCEQNQNLSEIQIVESILKDLQKQHKELIKEIPSSIFQEKSTSKPKQIQLKKEQTVIQQIQNKQGQIFQPLNQQILPHPFPYYFPPSNYTFPWSIYSQPIFNYTPLYSYSHDIFLPNPQKPGSSNN